MTDAASFPTPNPRPETDITAPKRADLDAARQWLELCGSCDVGLPQSCTCPSGDPRSVIQRLIEEIEGWRALDLPARDARIRAEVAEEIRAARQRAATWEPSPGFRAATTRRELESYRTGQMAGLRIAECLAESIDAPAESVAAGSAVPVEGSGHPQPAPRVLSVQQPVAEGICESCGDPVVYNLAIGYVAHKDADESTTCTEPYPWSVSTADVVAAAERRGYGRDGVTLEGES